MEKITIKFRDGTREIEISGTHADVDGLIEKWLPLIAPEFLKAPESELDAWLATQKK